MFLVTKILKTKILTAGGVEFDAQAPVIVSASRSTDIPAFYSDWFFDRLEKNYSAWINPFNGVKSYVSYQNTRLIVFWSKNPKPLLEHLPKLKKKKINTYIQFTLNNYEQERLELGVPNLLERIDTFKRLVDVLGKGHVIWRNDPLVLSDKLSIPLLLDRLEYIAEHLKGYSEKLVFSFVDIESYKKVKTNLSKLESTFCEFTNEQMLTFAKELSNRNKSWGFDLATCGEKVDLQQFGILKNKCIDDVLIEKLFSHDSYLMEHLGIKTNIHLSLFDVASTTRKSVKKDCGQREACGCIKSKDIGEYNTCPHLCEYCYANTSKKVAQKNYSEHLKNKYLDTITGR